MDSNMNLPNNSRIGEDKNEDIRVRKVVGGEVRKKSLSKRFFSLFTPDDKVDIKGYLLDDVILPTIKNAVLTSIDMLLPWGGSGSFRPSYINRNQSRSRGFTDRVSYDREYDRRNRYDRYESGIPRWEDDITFLEYAKAMEALQELEYILREYHYIRITDLYDVAGRSIGRYGTTLKHYGWTTLRGVKPVRIGREWGLSFPKAMELED